MEEQIQVVQEEVSQDIEVQETVKVKNYLNGKNRNTYAAFIRSRSEVIHPQGKTYNAGKNKAKAVRTSEKNALRLARRIAKRVTQVD